MKKLAPAVLALALLIAHDAGTAAQKAEQQNGPGKGITTILLPARPGATPSIPVDITSPEQNKPHRGDILVLPGWNFSRKQWQTKTPLTHIANKKGFRCVFPEMTVTLYESRYYPETKMKWSSMPGGQWVKTVLVPELQKRGLLVQGGCNYVMGLSTGGRGAVLLCLQNPGLFKAAASLSGDFDQTAMPADRLMTAVYGPFKEFCPRWKNDDNPMNRAADWDTPLYLGHGRADRVVPFSQSLDFYRALKKKHPPAIAIIFNGPHKAGHDFKYWSSEVGPVLNFFDSIK